MSKENADLLLREAQRAGITDKRELAIFMGQMQHESGNFNQLVEGMKYRPERLLEVFGPYTDRKGVWHDGRNGLTTIDEARAITSRGQEGIANAMYGGKWGLENLGNTEPGDGWKYRGRGFTHLTGREGYETMGKKLGLDLVNHPELASDPEIAAKIAVQFWKDRVVSRGHQLDVGAATKDINGGTTGLADRRVATQEWERKFQQGYLERLGTVQPEPGRERPAAGSTSPAGAMADGQLKRGEEGPEVKRLQERLNALGYGRADGTPLVTNGTFGPNTEAAVVKFQKEHGLQGLGVVGTNTLAALDAAEQAKARGGQTPERPAPTPERSDTGAKAPASHAIYSEAHQHFLASGNKFEYGRGDMTLNNREGNGKTDRSRTEQDLDRDGLKGVDCSSFVWRGLKNAGYGVPKEPFSTHALFNGSQVTDYAKKNFDVIPAGEAKRANGSLQPGDIVMFKDKDSGGQHVGIVKGYDSKGHLEFIGSQVSTGPAAAKAGPGSYWNGGEFEIVGALRAKPEFQVRAPLNGTPDLPAGNANPRPSPTTTPTAGADGQLKRGEEGPEVKRVQERLNDLGYKGADGKPLAEDGKFGPNTEAAVIRFQKEHGLQGLGMVGPKTMTALDAAEKAQAQGGQTREQTPAPQGKGGMALNAAYDMSVKYDDVKYGFGSKNLATGKVDCSGWVSQLQNATMDEINQKAGKTVFSGKDYFDKHNQAAADIIKDSVNTTGTLMRSPLDASKLKEGMIIGEDNGKMYTKQGVQWDAGRYQGIDHITMVVKDPKSGQLMVSQSRGGEGVELMPLDKYLERKEAKGVELFATDPLAKARPLIEAAPQQQERTGALLSDPANRDNGMYRQALAGIDGLKDSPFKTPLERENAAAAMVADARAAGMGRIDHVVQAGNGQMFAVQGDLASASHQRIAMDPQQLAQQPLQKSSETVQQLQQTQLAQVEEPRPRLEAAPRAVA